MYELSLSTFLTTKSNFKKCISIDFDNFCYMKLNLKGRLAIEKTHCVLFFYLQNVIDTSL